MLLRAAKIIVDLSLDFSSLLYNDWKKSIFRKSQKELIETLQIKHITVMNNTC